MLRILYNRKVRSRSCLTIISKLNHIPVFTFSKLRYIEVYSLSASDGSSAWVQKKPGDDEKPASGHVGRTVDLVLDRQDW